ncbi:ABC transporter ATP-binding protein [Mesobacillus subterraneus]|uniref:ABC transporter ATP-binding protein n=1 Tax=Mesobacillus subterraneus TaxID=285983 RepID=UPI00203C03B7|nr:ABC transporter ATP-binding protein [Mesobacillus subterraneus]MCM3666100.1 ABC transporter ATP-binding protein [Mesobacillus subterraneus]MCM3685098.1 ABC transporter ATP-binding protein [Mesobacillus subterraneus]
MSDITLSVKGLRKTIGKKEIIKGLDFDLKRGEVFGFLGPNGAGKTTTIRMLVGLIKPSSGSIEIGGYNVRKNFTKAMSQMGCIVENPELYSYLTGWENLEHFARMLPEVDRAYMEYVVDLVRLNERIHDQVKTYSLGMRQRLGIAQALLGKPKVLILDEPTNGLDPMGIREMRNFIRYLAEEEGLTVLVSSHLLSEIQLMCDRVAIISKGAVIKVDYVENLLAMQERVIWQVEPRETAKDILSEVTSVVEGPDGALITPYIENAASSWNRLLVEKGVEVKEMNRKLPALEDLFLELTGGESID